jgi:hypothetical protein
MSSPFREPTESEQDMDELIERDRQIFERGEDMTTGMREWQAWKEVVRLLEETGAVTKEDSSAPQKGLTAITPGTRLYAAIREWGEMLADLRVEYASSVEEDCS